LYWFGVLAFTINFLMQLPYYFTGLHATFYKDGKFRIIEVTGNKAPSSFLNFIFINPESMTGYLQPDFTTREDAWAQKHSVDILLLK
jgi:hypothetical protein